MSKLRDMAKEGVQKGKQVAKTLAVEAAAETVAETIVKGGMQKMTQGKNNTGSQKGETLTGLFVKLIMERWKKSGAEYRHEMWAFVETQLEERASRNLKLRHKYRAQLILRPYGNKGKNDEDKVYYQDGDEQHMVSILGGIYRHLDDNTTEHKIRLELFNQLGNMSHETFDATLEAFHDDRILQYVRKGFSIIKAISEQIKQIAPEVYKNAEELIGKAVSRSIDGIEIADEFVGEEISKLGSQLNEQWWVMQPGERSVTKKIIDRMFGGK